MSPTSYQTAPPRALIITTVPRRVKLARICKHAPSSPIDCVPFTFRHDFRGIHRLFIQLFSQDLSVFSDQEVHTPRRFVFVSVDTVLVSDLASPIAQQREADADLLGECSIRKRTIHTHTQN